MRKILLSVAVLFLLTTSNTYSQICNGDFNCDGNVAADDVTMFLVDYGRNQYNNPCVPCRYIDIPKTGQAESCEDYDDGYYEKGFAWPDSRFTDNGNGTVTDNLTGLIWLEDANCFGQRTWSQALFDCNSLTSGSCGLTDGSSAGDWRLPNVKEFLTLIDFWEAMPALPLGHPFTNVQTDLQPDDYYWSSTTYRAYTYGAWALRMFDGYSNGHYKTGNYYIWPVRGGQ